MNGAGFIVAPGTDFSLAKRPTRIDPFCKSKDEYRKLFRHHVKCLDAQQTHATHDQFFRIEEGAGALVIDGVTRPFKYGDGIIVPAGAVHNLTNAGIFPGPVCLRGGAARHIASVRADFWEATPRLIHPRILK